MLNVRLKRALFIIALVVLVGALGAATVATSQSECPTTSVEIDASPTNPSETIRSDEAIHTVVFTVGEDATSPGESLKKFEVDYTVDTPTADVSNVGAGTIERFGVDRSGDAVGTRIDVEITESQISEVSGGGKDITFTIADGEEVPVSPGDQVVLVLNPVQNPQTNAPTVTPQVNATIDPQTDAPVSGSDTATDTVRYENNSASVSLDDQTTTGDSVVVERVNLSEGGWVAIHNETGNNPGAVQGNSSYLEPGMHTDVEIPLDPSIEPEAQPELYATAHLDTNGNQKFDYVAQNREADEIYLNADGNPQTGNGDSDSAATITYNEPPTAEANGRYRVDEGGTVTLDASGSSDPDGNVTDTSWTVTSGPGSVSGDTYDAPDNTDGDTFAVVELTVTDDDGDTDTNQARIDIQESDTSSDDDSSDTSSDDDSSDTSSDDSTPTPTPTATDGDNGTSTPTPTPTDGDDGSSTAGDDGTTDGDSGGNSDDGDTTDDGFGDDGTPTPTPTPAGGTDTPTETGSGSPEIGGLGGTSLVILPLVALVLLVGGLYAVFGRRERE